MKEGTQIPIDLVAFLVLLILKLTQTIDWSWWWVVSPVVLWPAFLFAVRWTGRCMEGLGTGILQKRRLRQMMRENDSAERTR